MNTRLTLCGVVTLAAASSALAGSHNWRFDEVFTNVDGSVQYIEMVECCGTPNEIFLENKWVLSTAGGQFNFPGDLTGPTNDRHLLLATQSFADLAGAPTPDFIIPEGLFSPSDLQTLEYWLYGPPTWTIPAGAIPTDGVNALSRNGTVGQNRPENYAGDQGTVTAPCHAADIDASGQVDVSDLLATILAWGNGVGDPADINGDGTVDIQDLLAVILAWGVC